MDAKVKNGIAVLEEFLQEKYVENFDNIEKDDNSKIANLVSVCPNYFYVPRVEGFGLLDYIEYDGKAFYLIKKQNLPEEIRESLVGGDAGKGEYTDYVSLNDVYGVTSNLKVYYCSGGLDSIQNLAKEDVDNAKERDVFTDLENDGLGKLLSPYDSSKDGKIQSTEISSITELELTETVDLKNIYNLYSLEKLIIKEVKDIDLTGIENCMNLKYIWFYKGSAKSYEPIGKLEEKLTTLIFSGAIQTDVEKLCSEIKDYELTGLTYLAFFGSGLTYNASGPVYFMNVTDRRAWEARISEFTTLIPFNDLKDSTKKSIKYLWLFGNKLENLNELNGFENLIYLNAMGNNLNNIEGLKNCKKIEYLRLDNNKFNDNDLKQNNETDSLYCLQNLSELNWLDISINSRY